MSKVLLVYEDYPEMTMVQSVLMKVGFDTVAISSEFSLTQQILSFNPDIVIGHGKGQKVSTIGVGRRLKEMPRWGGRTVLIFPAGLKPDPRDLIRIRMDMALEAPVEITRLLQVLAHLTGQLPQDLMERMAKALAQEAMSKETRIEGKEPQPEDSPIYVQGAPSANSDWANTGASELDDFNRLMGVPTQQESSPPAQQSKRKEQFPLEPHDPVPTAPMERETSTGHLPWKDVLEASKKQMEAKKARYAQILAETPEPKQKELRRRDTKKAQKQMAEEWSQADLESQDEMRRKFTKAMFKKND